MNKPPNFANARAFKASLEQRLKNESKALDRPYAVLRKLVAFERLSARIFSREDPMWALKGGSALELRLGKSRTTQDIDLVIQNKKILSLDPSEQAAAIRAELQKKTGEDLGDFFAFKLGAAIALIAPTVGGVRVPVQAEIGGEFFESFRLDVAVAETDPAPLEKITRESWLNFYGIPSTNVYAIPESLQFAEKLHAYTFQWQDRQNTREKDLLDMVVMIERGLDQKEAAARIQSVFSARKTHNVPQTLPSPPSEWGPIFERSSEEIGYSGNMETAFEVLSTFFEKASSHI